MAAFEEFDVEIENTKESDPEDFVGSVATAGTPVTITPTNGRPIRHAFIECNSVRHSTANNNINDVIKYSIDGGTVYHEVAAGEWIEKPGVFTDITIDTNTNGTNYSITVWG